MHKCRKVHYRCSVTDFFHQTWSILQEAQKRHHRRSSTTQRQQNWPKTRFEHSSCTNRKCVVHILLQHYSWQWKTQRSNQKNEACWSLSNWAMITANTVTAERTLWPAALVTSTACKFSGYASDTEHKLVISRALGNIKTAPSGLVLIYPSCWYNLNIIS